MPVEAKVNWTKSADICGKNWWLFGAILVIICLPQQAFADAGTPLMWAGILHLVIGNAFIGIAEGLLLAKVFKLKKLKTAFVMIAANYFSAWVGDVFLGGFIVSHLHADLNNGWRWFWIMVVVTYFMTLVLEWPFVAFCFRGTDGCLRKSLKGNFIVQTASYVVLFGWYWFASGTSLYTKMVIVSPMNLHLPDSVLVYFISQLDGDVYLRHGSGSEDQRIFDLHSTNENDRLFVRKSTIQSNSWDLFARFETGDYRHPTVFQVKEAITHVAVLNWREKQDPPREEGTWFNFGQTPQLGEADKSHWTFDSGFYPIEGLSGTNDSTHDHMFFSYETPFGQWAVRNAMQLPGDLVLFQLGENQICVVDPNLKKVALLAHGRGPVAVISK